MNNNEQPTIIKCTICGRVFGETYSIFGTEFLRLPSGLVVRYLSGVCDCGSEFHYSVSEKTLTKLLASIENRR